MLKRGRKAFLKWRYGEPVIVVSGLPRSGTSMMMKMLAAGGVEVWTDKIRKADDDNPKGYFELEKIKKLHKEEDKSWLKDARGKAIKVISELLKELPQEQRYKLIFMNRHLDEVIASQNRMLENRGESFDPTRNEALREMFEKHLWKVRSWLKQQPQYEVGFFDYGEVLQNPAASAERIRELLEMELDVDAMAEVVDPSLYRNRAEAQKT